MFSFGAVNARLTGLAGDYEQLYKEAESAAEHKSSWNYDQQFLWSIYHQQPRNKVLGCISRSVSGAEASLLLIQFHSSWLALMKIERVASDLIQTCDFILLKNPLTLHSLLPRSDFEEPIPDDRYHGIYFAMLLAGVGFLLPYNSFITDVDYLHDKFKGMNMHE